MAKLSSMTRLMALLILMMISYAEADPNVPNSVGAGIAVQLQPPITQSNNATLLINKYSKSPPSKNAPNKNLPTKKISAKLNRSVVIHRFNTLIDLATGLTSRKETTDLGSTSTNNAYVLPRLRAKLEYHLGALGITDTALHLAPYLEAEYQMHSTGGTPLGADTAYGLGTAVKNVMGVSSIKVSVFIEATYLTQHLYTLRNSETGYAGPAVDRSNKLVLASAGPELKTLWLTSWQQVSLKYSRSLSCSAVYPSGLSQKKCAENFYTAELQLGLISKSYLTASFTRGSGSSSLSLTSSQSTVGLGWVF